MKKLNNFRDSIEKDVKDRPSMDTFDEEIGRLEKSLIKLRVDLEDNIKANKDRLG